MGFRCSNVRCLQQSLPGSVDDALKGNETIPDIPVRAPSGFPSYGVMYGYITPPMENLMEKQMDNEMETRVMKCFICPFVVHYGPSKEFMSVNYMGKH